MFQIRKTDVYARWLDGLNDLTGRARILVRTERLAAGHPGDVKPVGDGVWELVYFIQNGREIVILLAGGDKSSQSVDIKTALKLAKNLKE